MTTTPAFAQCENTGFHLRLALVGPSGSGKTYSALSIATELGYEKIGILDTEARSARRYAKSFSRRFLSMELDRFSPADYIAALQAAHQAGIEVLVVDSLSHAWMGRGGILEMVDASAKRQQGNSFAGWRTATPEHNRLVEMLVHAPFHLIVCMRVKQEWVVEKDEKTGKTVPKKIGLAPVQREGLEYEFDVVGDLNQEHELLISKSRCPALADAVVLKPGKDFALALRAWLDGAEPARPQAPPGIDWTARVLACASGPQVEDLLTELRAARAAGTAPRGDAGLALKRVIDVRRAQLGLITGQAAQDLLEPRS